MSKNFNIIQHLKDSKGLNGAQIARKLNVSPAYISSLSKGKPIGKDVAIKISEAFDLPLTLILTGEEEISETNIRPIHQNARDVGHLSIYDDDGLNKFVEISPGRYRMGVELVPVHAQAGYLSGYMDQEYLEELPKHYITVDKFVKGNYKAFEISGDSMDNGSIKDALPHGTIVTCREVKRELWTSKFHTHEWPNWIIVHRYEGIVAKQIAKQCLETGTLTLRSLNPDKKRYPDFDVNLDDCVQIFNVVKRELK